MRVLIADDESTARARLTRLVGAIEGAVVVGEVEDGAAVLNRVRAGGVDVVLLDIAMPGLSGVEAMQLWPVGGPAIVFVTAHADQAVAAFEGGAVDYLLKPVAPARLASALSRVAGRRVAPPAPIAVETRQGVVLLPPAGIVAVVVDGASTVVHADRGRYYTERTLAELEIALAGRLERVHRAALLNLDRVRRFEPVDSGGYLAWTDLELTVPVSRQAARALRRRWGLGPVLPRS